MQFAEENALEQETKWVRRVDEAVFQEGNQGSRVGWGGP